MFLNAKRIFKFAFTDFSRDKGANLAAIFVLVVTIFLITSLFIFQGIAKFLILQVQEKIDVSAYFKESATEDDILKVKDEISKISSEVQYIQYVSKEEALADFKEKHKDNPDFMSALEEVGINPFLASLSIKTKSSLQYEEISNLLGADQYRDLIEKVDYYEKKPTIEKVFSVISTINKFGIGLSIILILIAIFVVLNTIKLAVYNSKEEIKTMKLVGASNWFIRGPFVVQGAMSGFFAGLICLLIFAGATFSLSPNLGIILPGFNLFGYFLSNLGIILLIQLGFGIFLGAITSYVVVRKHLDV